MSEATDGFELLFMMFCLTIACLTVVAFSIQVLHDLNSPTKVNVTWANYTLNSSECLPEGEYGYGHGDGQCGHSEHSCAVCNCTVKIETWCNNKIIPLPENPTRWNAPYDTPQNATMGLTNFENVTINTTHQIYAIGVGGGGGCPSSGCPPEINWTLSDEKAKALGENCTAFSCGWWAGYETRGFYNLSGVYYDNGTPTWMTLKQMSTLEEINANYRYNKYMNSKGYYYDGKKWKGNGL